MGGIGGASFLRNCSVEETLVTKGIAMIWAIIIILPVRDSLIIVVDVIIGIVGIKAVNKDSCTSMTIVAVE